VKEQRTARETWDGVSKIRVGPAGWDYPDWKGAVYPRKPPKGFDPLPYLAGYFDTIEINSTFYRPARPDVAATWAERVSQNPRFRFTSKLWRRFTHERDTAWTSEDVKVASGAFKVLKDCGRLGAVLLQFPWSFRRDASSEEWLRDLFKAFGEFPLVLEVRHETWNSPEMLSDLTERGVGLVNVDQPLFKNSLKASSHSSSAVGYVRLHGRNYKEWFRKDAGRDERYDYLYSEAELRPWVERIKEIAARPGTREVYAVTNNHRVGKAPANADMIAGMLTGGTVPVPPELYARYETVLKKWGAPSECGRHGATSNG
jgi:uncharacterized protein YecE (DUF72 family)